MEIRTTGTQSWLKMNNKFGSAWEVTNAPGLPWDFQFTSDSTQQVGLLSTISRFTAKKRVRLFGLSR